jgi:hypothetical protein
VGSITSEYNRSVDHEFTKGPHWKRINETSYINTSSLLMIFTLLFVEVMSLLVVETNQYHYLI